MDIAQALHELGVTDKTLSSEEKAFLDREGYLPLPGILSPEQVTRLQSLLDNIAAREGEAAGIEVHQEEGASRLSDLVNKDSFFDLFYTQPRVLAAVSHVLDGNLRLSSLNSRAALPGQGLQHLHADYGQPVEPGDYRVCNSIWLVDDFTPDNGSTRVVPGSHRSGRMPQDEMSDPGQPHPGEIQIVASAGTVVVFNSHTWHGGTINRTDMPRRGVHAYFGRREESQQTDQRKFLRPETRARISQAARVILDVN